MWGLVKLLLMGTECGHAKDAANPRKAPVSTGMRGRLVLKAGGLV